MAGYIVYNGFWNAQPPSAVTALVAAAARQQLRLTPLANTEVFARFIGGGTRLAAAAVANGDFALFLDKDTRLARAMEAAGVRLYNTAAAVAVCDDKAATHLALAAAGLPQPETWVAPMAYTDYTAAGERFLCCAEQALGYPLVVKECFGSLGGQVYLARDPQQLRKLVAGMAARPFVLQKFVAATAGEDVRLYVVGGEVVAAMKRHNAQDFRANIAGGGHGERYTPPAEEMALALRCCEVLGLDYAGVDLLHEADGTPLVCEVNSCAFTAEISAVTGVDVPGCIVKMVKAKSQKE